jgi:hypothetical protein
MRYILVSIHSRLKFPIIMLIVGKDVGNEKEEIFDVAK